jgi:hypothetical protein
MRIKRHHKSYLVKLSDGSVWHIWPCDLAKTLQWVPTTDIDVVKIDHQLCSHALVDGSNGSSVKVSSPGTKWPLDVVREMLTPPNQADKPDGPIKPSRESPIV